MEFSRIVTNVEYDMAALMARTDAWVVVLDPQQRILESNALCPEILDISPAAIQGKLLADVLPVGHIAFLLKAGLCFRSQPILIGDRKLICHYVPRVSNSKVEGGVLVVDPQPVPRDNLSFVDLLDIVRSLSAVMDLAYEGTILVDHEGYIVLVNQAFADLLGARAQDMVGKHILKAYPNSKCSRLPIVMQTGRSEVGWPHNLNGREVVVSRYPLVKHGRAIGALGKVQFQDVEEVLRMADRFQSRAQAAKPSAVPQVAKVGAFSYDINSIIGHSKVIVELKETLMRVAERSSNVLLVGESGTGKELFAHALHAASKRRYAPFIKMNCAAIPEHLLESELFGYVDGAFTGAKRGGQVGKFELAHNGTIFLDEISDMSLPMQAKLLRILQERELTPLGSNASKKVDVRIVAATNVKLEKLVQQGKFREDLYYRLNVMYLAIPPLRERTEDIYFIAGHFIETFNSEFGLQVQGLDPEAWDLLKAYPFPGNIRELRNVVECAFNVVAGPLIRLEDLPAHIRQVSPGGLGPVASGAGPDQWKNRVGRDPLPQIMDEVEKSLLGHALEKVQGNKQKAALMLGISRPGFYKKLQKLGMA